MDNFVSFEHVSKTFNAGSVNQNVIFSDFNLSIPKGSFVSVVGSNGSGKTTMLNLLCGSLPVDSGTIKVGGTDVTKLKEHQRSAFLGRVYQDPSAGTCPNLTILENMALADNKGKSYFLQRGVNRKRINDYKEKLSLLRMGLEDKLEQRVSTLSGGQRQALALLIAAETDLDLLILDEHTAALDPNSAATVMELTKRVVEEKHVTTLMVTHNLKFAADYGDRLFMMHRGNIVYDISGETKNQVSIRDLTDKFDEISIEDGN